MLTGESNYLENLAKDNLCAEHKSPLEVAWHSERKTYVLRCGEDHYPDSLVRNPSLTQEAKRSIIKPVEPSLSMLPTKDLGSNVPLTPDQVKRLIIYGQKYGLDTYRGHVVLMYGKPYITIDGYYYHASSHGKHLKVDTKPLSEELRPEYMIPEGAHAWLCIVSNCDTGEMFSGIGIVTREEMEAKSARNPEQLASPVVAKHPWQLAQKRAEWQGLRRADPIGESPEETSRPPKTETRTVNQA